MMADQGAFLVPTLTVFIFHREMGMPAAQIEAQDFRHHHVESAQKAMAAGVRVVAGTDAGGWVHGNNAQELQCLVEAGMAPMEALLRPQAGPLNVAAWQKKLVRCSAVNSPT